MTAEQVTIGLKGQSVTVYPFLYESHGCYKYNSCGECVVEKGYTKREVEVPHSVALSTLFG